MFYFADTGSECDFLAKDTRGGMVLAQITWELNDHSRECEFTGSLTAMRQCRLSQGLIITGNQENFAVYEGCEIRIVPAWKYLGETVRFTNLHAE